MHEAIDNVWHVSNLYHIPEQQKLAKVMRYKFCDKVFCNSGAEAVEQLKLLKYHFEKVIKIEQASLLLRMRSMEELSYFSSWSKSKTY